MPVVTAVVNFLRAGYPDGVPEQDYIPLLALLRRRLTDEEVADVVDRLVAADDTDSARALHAAISEITNEPPRTEDIARVSARLAAGGWPLAGTDALFPDGVPEQ
jgi:alkylhydroperoxidase family enzyme